MLFKNMYIPVPAKPGRFPLETPLKSPWTPLKSPQRTQIFKTNIILILEDLNAL